MRFLQFWVGLLYSAGTPFSHIFGYIAGVIAIPLIIASGVYKYHRKSLLFLLIILLWASIRTIFVQNHIAGIHWIISAIAHWSIPFLAGASLANTGTRWTRIHIWSWVAVIIIGLISATGIMPEMIAQKVWKEEMMWGFHHHNWFSADIILAIALFLTTTENWHMMKVVQFALLLLGFVLSGSRGYYIAMIPVALGFGLTSKSKTLMISVIVALSLMSVLILVVPSISARIERALCYDKAVISRLHCWECALSLWKEHLLFGIGYGQIPEYAEYFREYSTHSFIDIRAGTTGGMLHNIYLTYLLEGGIIGLLIFLFFLASIGSELWKAGDPVKPLFWAFIALLLGNFFDTQLRGPSVATEFFFFIGMFLQKSQDVKSKNATEKSTSQTE